MTDIQPLSPIETLVALRKLNQFIKDATSTRHLFDPYKNSFYNVFQLECERIGKPNLINRLYSISNWTHETFCYNLCNATFLAGDDYRRVLYNVLWSLNY